MGREYKNKNERSILYSRNNREILIALQYVQNQCLMRYFVNHIKILKYNYLHIFFTL